MNIFVLNNKSYILFLLIYKYIISHCKILSHHHLTNFQIIIFQNVFTKLNIIINIYIYIIIIIIIIIILKFLFYYYFVNNFFLFLFFFNNNTMINFKIILYMY